MTSVHTAVDNDVLGVKKERSLSPNADQLRL